PYARLHAAYLGAAFDPVYGEFHGAATRSIVRTTDGPAETVRDPHLGITADGRFELAAGSNLTDGMTLDRLNTRRSLLDQLDSARRELDRSPTGRRLDENRSRALALMGSLAVRVALDLG